MQNGSANFTTANGLCEKETEREMVAHAVFLSVVMALTLFGNFLVIGTVATYEKLRTVTNYFVISLAVSDILVGLITLPLKVCIGLIKAPKVISLVQKVRESTLAYDQRSVIRTARKMLTIPSSHMYSN